ncbi:hypothetical protein ACIHAA_21560 [Streptomyces sp. NPDC052040]|uniref:hypothetical protein n=1 Tax=Streptomyces sp. NPDC052040 TaxID=3365682 RepID=UPI0037D39A02
MSLPKDARVTIRTLADQRREGRARIASALHELEESRYLRRVVHKDRETGHLSTVYEVFDTPYEDEPPAGESGEAQNPASGEPPSAPSGTPPTGEKTREQDPPSPPPDAGTGPTERTALAARLLNSLGRSHPGLTLGAADALRLAPLVEEWWDAGATSAQVRAALTDGLPSRVHSPRALLENRLRRKRPSPPVTEPVTTVGVESRTPGATAYREAARRGGALALSLLRGHPAPA